MKNLIIVSLTFICLSCGFEELLDIEESVFELGNDFPIIKIVREETQVYLGNEWETFVYLSVDRDYLKDLSFNPSIAVYKNGQYYRSITSNTFYDKASYNSTHCYSFGLAGNGQLSEKYVEDYCIDFK